MDDRAHTGPRPDDVGPAGLSPVRAFFVVGAVLAATVMGFLATREPSPATPTVKPSRSPDYSLTDAEAIAEFERLKNTLASAYRRRDVTLVKELAAPDAAAGIRRIDDEIRTLIADAVLYRTRETRLSLEVLANRSFEVEVREVVVKRPRFIDERTGENVATNLGPERQEIVWILRRYGTDWRVYSATIVSAERVAKGKP